MTVKNYATGKFLIAARGQGLGDWYRIIGLSITNGAKFIW